MSRLEKIGPLIKKSSSTLLNHKFAADERKKADAEKKAAEKAAAEEKKTAIERPLTSNGES